jgi:hypothetical protein
MRSRYRNDVVVASASSLMQQFRCDPREQRHAMCY